MSFLGTLFGTRSVEERSVVLNVVGGETTTRNYENAIKTNRKIAREIYHNVNKKYALAGQLVRPIVNNNVNFIGTPTLFGNRKTVKLLEELNIDYRSIHKSIEIDGSIFVWAQWDGETIKLVQIPVDIVDKIFINPITKEVTGYRLKETIKYSTPEEDNQSVVIVCVITKDIVKTTITGSINKKIVAKNILGELPLVHFSNDKDTNELYGHSEIEPIEPQLKFYHELTYEAGAAQSRDGHPKLKVTTSKPKQWIDSNFGAGAYDSLVKNGGKISMEDRDLFVNAEGDDVNYLYLNKTTGDYGSLSETTFMNIVEGSETPEINFGANMGTSLASVKEYRPVWIKKIEAKQYERTAPWIQLYKLIVKVYNFVNIKNLKSDIVIAWSKPNFASAKEQSEIINAFSKALSLMLKDGSITKEEMYDTLKELDILELDKSYSEHKKTIDMEVTEREAKVKENDNADPASSGDEGTNKTGKNKKEGSE